jgi:outer membrane lipoprotein-sorting protein
MFAALAFSIALAQDKPAVDHSAEPALRQLFQRAGELREVHAVITQATRSSDNFYMAQQTTELWLGRKGQFRMETIGNMGDESLLVSDGMSIMNDPLSDDDPITLNYAGKPLHELVAREPIAFLLEGPTGYDKLVDPAQSVVFSKANADEKSIEFHSKDLGKIVVTYRDSDDQPLPLEIDTYRSPRRRDVGTELPYPSLKEFIRLTGVGPQPSGLFSVVPPKGKKVEDQRQKVGKSN